jgi:4-hydroxybutyrate CoA-transferase
MSWRDTHGHKIVSAAEAVRHVRSGQVVAITGSAEPARLIRALEARRDELAGVRITDNFPLRPRVWLQDPTVGRFRARGDLPHL